MRKAITITALILAVGILAPASALGKAGGTDRPIKGSMTGVDTANLATGQVHVVLRGQVSHLGKVLFVEEGQVIPTGPGTLNWNSTWTVTAANGDQGFGTCTGTVTTPEFIHFTLLLDCAATEGTGRFEGASATFTGEVHSTRVSVDGVIATQEVESATLNGTISY